MFSGCYKTNYALTEELTSQICDCQRLNRVLREIIVSLSFEERIIKSVADE